jgi:hypothetical protein
VTRLAFFRVVAPVLQGSVNGDQPPPVEQPAAVEHAHSRELAHHVDRDLSDGAHGNPRRMTHGIPRTGDSPAGSQTLFIPDVLAQLHHVGWQLAGVAVAIEGVAGTATQQEGQQDLPPDVPPFIGAPILATGIRQRVEPAV